LNAFAKIAKCSEPHGVQTKKRNSNKYETFSMVAAAQLLNFFMTVQSVRVVMH